MIKIDNLEVGKRYWFDEAKNISGVFRGRFNPEPGLDYISFNDIIKNESYNNYRYFEVNGIIEFAYMEDLTFPECEITSEQLELVF